ncbi:putative prefoldin subunit 2 [Zea mays]|uniref:Putative prefoldin subunit 2 n=1 Tax=Zea mays TaxID=4577 RepID=A0A3L6FV65_MAIZE|nr:putative prefoldin subunit 2 [Zea mays]
MASKAGGDGKEAINEQVVANTYANMRTEMNQLYTKITELEMEVSEHSLVIGAIEPLDPSRRCYRMIGGVLVERTIKEVLPAVKRNKEGLEEVIARMHEALERKKKEITEFELKYKIRIRKADNDAEDEGGKKEGTAQGVLVGPAGHFKNILYSFFSAINIIRAVANMDIKLDFVPPWLINFISRQLIGSGHKLYQKAVSTVASHDGDYRKALRGSLYARIREYQDSDNKAKVAPDNATTQNRLSLTNTILNSEIVEETEQNTSIAVDNLPTSQPYVPVEQAQRVESKPLYQS